MATPMKTRTSWGVVVVDVVAVVAGALKLDAPADVDDGADAVVVVATVEAETDPAPLVEDPPHALKPSKPAAAATSPTAPTDFCTPRPRMVAPSRSPRTFLAIMPDVTVHHRVNPRTSRRTSSRDAPKIVRLARDTNPAITPQLTVIN